MLGAVAAGIGVGLFLAKANSDRKRLASQLNDAHIKAERALEQSQRTAEEANQKLREANEEMAKAETIIAAMEEERRFIAQAEQLSAPPPYATDQWSEQTAVQLGISIKTPSGATIIENTSSTLRVGTVQNNEAWLDIRTYDTALETAWRQDLTSTTTRIFLVRDRVLIGVTGTRDHTTSPVFVLRAQTNGVPTHLILIRDPADKTGARNRVQNILATMTFK